MALQTAAHDGPVLFLALELSKSAWLLAAHLPGANKPKLHRIEAGDTAALLAAITALRARVAGKSGTAVDVACCFESGRDGFWLHRLLTANGVASHVLEPTSILVNRRARRAETDRLDAQGLLRVLTAHCRGDRQACSMVRVPTPEEEDAKRLHREREHLVQERVRVENRIEALLATQGIRGRPSLRSWERDMTALRTGDGRALPTQLRAELDRLRRRFVLTLEMIREVEAERAAALAAEPQDDSCRTIAALCRRRRRGTPAWTGRPCATGCTATTPRDSRACATGPGRGALCRIRGIGETSATVLAREVLYRPFANRKQLASCVGLAPMPYQSGGMDRDRRISRSGNPRARTAIIQLAWLWLRYQPGSALAGWFRGRVGALAGRTRRIAIVAMARKLLIALWRYARTGLLPEGVEIGA